MIIILATIMTLLVACGGPKEATPIAKTLTKDELSYFNDELFSKADNFNLNSAGTFKKVLPAIDFIAFFVSNKFDSF